MNQQWQRMNDPEQHKTDELPINDDDDDDDDDDEPIIKHWVYI